jgi:hypothetical protein
MSSAQLCVEAQGLNNLAVIYTAQGKAQEALQTLQAATLADPGYAEVRPGRQPHLQTVQPRVCPAPSLLR